MVGGVKGDNFSDSVVREAIWTFISPGADGKGSENKPLFGRMVTLNHD